MIPSSLQPAQVYATSQGVQLCGDSSILLNSFKDESIDLIVTSPPFPLLREKAYGNKDQNEYVDWLLLFGKNALPKLKKTGSLVMDIGGAYQKGRPIRSLHQWRLLIRMCDEVGYHLAEEFYWHNPAKLPSPIEWVNKRKIRVKDSVNTIWWFSKTEWPKSNVKNVLAPYSDRMKKLIENPEAFYKAKNRPSGHEISTGFANDNGGSIPPNLLQYSNTDSNSHYLRICKILEKESHPARFPTDIPEFFIKFLTDPKDTVVDIFSGSNTTGYVAEKLDRNWVSIENLREYAILSSVRFFEDDEIENIKNNIKKMENGNSIHISNNKKQQLLFDNS